MISTTVTNNIAIGAGRIYLSGGSALSVYDSRIADNTAGQRAGVLVYDGSTLAMTNTFVVDNRAIAGEPGATLKTATRAMRRNGPLCSVSSTKTALATLSSSQPVSTAQS